MSDPTPTGPALVLDCRGRRCPLPILDLARAIGTVPLGATIEIRADDPAAAADIPAWCGMRAQTYLGPADPGDAPGYLVRRSR